jgi:hypothetical protein
LAAKWLPQVQLQLGLAVMQLSVAADANKGQTKGLVEAVGMPENDVT